MASSRIKGITVEIGGDTIGLNKALASTEKEIKSVQGQLKEVERLLKLDPGNTQLLEQRQRLLAQAVQETKGKLDTLKEAEKQVQEQFAHGEVSQEQYDALQREIISTEQNLKKLETQAASSNVALNKISVTADRVATATGKAATATKGLSMAAGGLIIGMAGAAVQAGRSADDINTLAKQTGLSTAEIQKFAYASDIIDVSLDTLTGSMAKLVRNMSSAKNGSKNAMNAFKDLGVSIVDNSGTLRNHHDVFNEVISALGRMENETQRDAYAMQIFGKSAQDLNPLILGGADALDRLGQEAEKAGLILGQDALDAANEFNDSIDLLKATAKGTFASIGTEIAQLLIPFMQDLGGAIKGVLQWLKSLSSGQLKFIGIVLMVVASLSPLLKIISNLSTAISFLTKTVLPGLGSALSFLANNPIVLLVGAIVGLVALIATKGEEILSILGTVDAWIQTVFTRDWSESLGFIGHLLNGFFATVSGIWDGIKGVFEGIINFIRGVFTGDWSRAWEGIRGIFSGIWNGLVAIVKAPVNSIIGLINAVIGGLNWMIRGINSIHIDIPGWIPIVGGQSIGFNLGEIGYLAYLAKGGILQSGSAIVGEAGPELLTVMGGKAKVTPLTNGVGSGLSFGGGITVNIEQFVNQDTGTDIRKLTETIMVEMESAVQRKRLVFG